MCGRPNRSGHRAFQSQRLTGSAIGQRYDDRQPEQLQQRLSRHDLLKPTSHPAALPVACRVPDVLRFPQQPSSAFWKLSRCAGRCRTSPHPRPGPACAWAQKLPEVEPELGISAIRLWLHACKFFPVPWTRIDAAHDSDLAGISVSLPYTRTPRSAGTATASDSYHRIVCDLARVRRATQSSMK